MAVWLRFAKTVDFDLLVRTARAKGVQILPGGVFVTAGQPIAATRLGFASMNAAELDRETRRLQRALTAIG